MSKGMAVVGLVVILGLASPGGWGQELRVDFDPFTEGIQDQKDSVQVGEVVEAHLVMTGANNLLGFSTDVLFDPAILKLNDIRENPGDLDFDSQLTFPELNDAINFFVKNVMENEPDWVLTDEANPEAPEQFWDSNDPPRRSGVLLDLNGDNLLDFPELNRIISTFVNDVMDPAGTTSRVLYWTDQVFGRPGFAANESVEIHDPPSYSNLGEAHEGEIRDITAVLLARPADVSGEGTRPDFGYDGDAVLVTLEFQALASGSSQIQFANSVYIDETFKDIGTDVHDVPSSLPGTVNVQ